MTHWLESERPEHPAQIRHDPVVTLTPATAEQIRAAVAEAATYPRLLREDREREAQENIRRTAVRVGRNQQAILRGGLSNTRRQIDEVQRSRESRR